jgi:hypothetical protein
VSANVVVEHFMVREEFEKDSVSMIDRVGPETMERPLQGVGFQTVIKRIGSEELIFFVGQRLKSGGQLAESAFKMRADADDDVSVKCGPQEISSFREWMDRVLPKR